MSYLLFIFYFILFSFLITRISFFKKSGLNNRVIILLFTTKIVAAFGYAFFYQLPAYRANSDTFRFFSYSILETNLLLKHPWQFCKELFYYGYQSSGNIFSGENSYWNDLKSNVIIKMMAVFNVFSFRNYYVNILFFNFLYFFGLIGFYRLMLPYFLEKKWLLIAATFLIPSFLFWCSGVHKDGLIFSATGLIFWLFNDCIHKKEVLKKALLIILLLVFIFTLRNYICFTLIICLTAWYLAKNSKHQLSVFLAVYAVSIALFFISPYIHPKLNFPQYIVLKQEEFKNLNGGSAIAVKSLDPSLTGFIKYFPTTVDIALVRPHIFEIKNKSYIPAIVENICFLLLLILCFFFRQKKPKLTTPILACIFFSFSVLLITGYTITFSGAIVRYKSLILPFLATAMLSLLDMNRLKAVLYKK